jgi:Zn-dependent M16 (insulinase) family peptidase
MDIISYFETFINSKEFISKYAINKYLDEICQKYFKGFVKIKKIRLHYGGWEIKAKGLRNQWVKAYVIDEGFTFKIYWWNSNEFLRWVANIIMHELAVRYNATVFSGKNLQITHPDEAYYKTFDKYLEKQFNDEEREEVLKSLPNKIKRAFL